MYQNNTFSSAKQFRTDTFIMLIYVLDPPILNSVQLFVQLFFYFFMGNLWCFENRSMTLSLMFICILPLFPKICVDNSWLLAEELFIPYKLSRVKRKRGPTAEIRTNIVSIDP
jgi:hypothetical protein